MTGRLSGLVLNLHYHAYQQNLLELIMSDSNITNTTDVSATQSQQEYFAKRQLKQGAVGWLLLVGLGVAYVISGDFAGWNFGLAQGGWGGMFIATVVVAFMYVFIYVRNGNYVTYSRWWI